MLNKQHMKPTLDVHVAVVVAIVVVLLVFPLLLFICPQQSHKLSQHLQDFIGAPFTAFCFTQQPTLNTQ